MNEEILKQALQYISLGWYVFPLHSVNDDLSCTCGVVDCSDAGKHPRVARGLKEASRDPEQIHAWFGKDAPKSNIAIVTGEISGITVIDVDVGKGKRGAESWTELTRDEGEPQTLIAETGSGGMHVLFKYNSALNTASNVLGDGIDCRNDGGYIVAAPSLHKSGGQYKWTNWGIELANLPKNMSKRKETRGRKRKDDMYNGKYTIEQVERMLEFIPSDDRDVWRSVGVILGRTFNRAIKAWDVYYAWSEKYDGTKGRNHSEIMHEAFNVISQQQTDKELSIGTIVKLAIDNGWAPSVGEVPINNFVYYGPGNNYIYRPTISLWISAAVDSAVNPVNEEGKIIKASDWLRKNQLVTSMTCDPSLEEDYIKGYDCRDGEISKVEGAALFNTYRKPTIELGDSKLAEPFLKHVRKVFNKKGDADQFLDYMAHRVQKPWEKPRFALMIAGGQGVGKDTAVEFCCPAIGSWNVANIDPSAFETNYNEYASAALVRVSEAANLHEMSKWAFNERTKVLIGGSPDCCTINPKYGQKYSVRMFCGVIITTNHLSSGIYIPSDDRRYDVIDSASMQEMGIEDENARREYFSSLWDWFLEGGNAHVAAYLNERDISNFSAANGQRKTEAHKTVVASGMTSDHWLTDILEDLDWPDLVRGDVVYSKAVSAGEKEGEVRRKISNAIGRSGYIVLRNENTKDGRWKIGSKNATVYVKVGAEVDIEQILDLKEMF